MKNSNLYIRKTMIAILWCLEILLAIGMGAIYHFSREKMGFMRYLVYLNRKIDKYLSTIDLPLIVTIFLSFIILYQLYQFVRWEKINLMLVILELFTIVIAKKIIFSGIENKLFFVISVILVVIQFFILKFKDPDQ